MKGGKCKTVEVDLTALADKMLFSLIGERQYTLAEANAMGYLTVQQMAAGRNVGTDHIRKRCNKRVAEGRFEKILLAGSSHGCAFREVVKPRRSPAKP